MTQNQHALLIVRDLLYVLKSTSTLTSQGSKFVMRRKKDILNILLVLLRKYIPTILEVFPMP